MSEAVVDLRCHGCGARLAKRVEARSGWIERKCRKCGQTVRVGGRSGAGNIIEVKCAGERRHVIGEASGDWVGAYVTQCHSCRPPIETTVERFDLAGPASSRASASTVTAGA